MSQDMLKLANKQIELGKPIEKIKTSLCKHYQQVDKQEFDKSISDDYYVLFPLTRDETVEEYDARIGELGYDDENLIIPSKGQVAIDYSQDENYLSFNDWLNQTKEVLIGTETATDDDGTEYEKEIFETQLVIEPYTLTKDFTDEIEAYIRKATTPQVVTMRQARLALLDVGMLDVVQGAIEQSLDESVKIEWEYATEIRRDWASFISLTQTMGMTSDELDDLFILAGSK